MVLGRIRNGLGLVLGLGIDVQCVLAGVRSSEQRIAGPGVQASSASPLAQQHACLNLRQSTSRRSNIPLKTSFEKVQIL